MGRKRENKPFLTKPNENDPKQTYTYSAAPTDIQDESHGLMIKNANVFKTIRDKVEEERIIKIT